MKSHSNAQNVARVFYVQQTFEAMRERTVVKGPILALGVINASLVSPMFIDT